MKNSLLENIINYLSVQINVFKKYEFYFCNLNLFFTKDEIESLEEFIKINNILVLNISRVYFSNLSIKNEILIDNDLCRIV